MVKRIVIFIDIVKGIVEEDGSNTLITSSQLVSQEIEFLPDGMVG